MLNDEWNKLQERLGYQFGDRGLLIQAMTHTSYGHENHFNKPIALRDNERLEFLGDSILDVILSDILLEAFPNANEGQLTKMRAAIVNEKTLAELTQRIHLEKCILLGKGESQTGGHKKSSILSCTFEALIAAIYLDGGFNAVYPVVRHLFVPYFEEERKFMAFYDYKSQLQEIVQARWRVTPKYTMTGAKGPDHAKVFDVKVYREEEIMGFASGSSKKDAEQNAAKVAIETLCGQPELN